jgi:hypothetical protein
MILFSVAVIISGRVSCDAQRRFIEGRALHWTIETIGFVINAPTAIRINAHETVRWVIHQGTAALINRNMRLRSTTGRF